MIAVSVVIPSRNRARRLAAMLASLRQQTLRHDRFEVIVVDDGSRDETPALLERELARGRLELSVLETSAQGPARARNVGWRSARAPVIAFTDDDCVAARDWLERGLDAAHRNPGAIVQGATVPIAGELAAAGPLHHTRRIERPGPWYETCNILYPSSLLEQLEGFDETFARPLGEDTDLGWRARGLGAPLVWAPDARVEHAVEELGMIELVAAELRAADAVLAFARHSGLRAEALRFGLIRNQAVATLALACASLALARRRPAAALLALPYCRGLVARLRAVDGGMREAPCYVAADLAAFVTALRGSLRHRRLVL